MTSVMKKVFIIDLLLTKMKTVLSFGVFRPRADMCSERQSET